MNSGTKLKPMPLWKAILLFSSTSALIYIAVYVAIPKFLDQGLTFLEAYLICFYSPFVIIFIVAFVGFLVEQGGFSWSAFRTRYRLVKIDTKTLLWIIDLTVFSLAAYLALTFTGKLLAAVAWLSPPQFFPAEINPNKLMTPGVFMDTPLKGQ